MYCEDGKKPKFNNWEDYLLLRMSPKWAECRAAMAEAAGSKRTRLGVSGNYSSSSAGEPSINLNDDFDSVDVQVEEPGPTMHRRQRPPGQQRSVREARAGSSRHDSDRAPSSVCGPSAPSGSRTAAAALADNLKGQRESNLLNATIALSSATNPRVVKHLEQIIKHLKIELGLDLSDDEGDAPGEGTD